MKQPRIVVMAGSRRREALSRRVAEACALALRDAGAEVELVDLDDYPAPLYDGDLEAASGLPEAIVRLQRVLHASDGVLVVNPEYNGSLTPLLKNTLDWVSRVRVEGEEPMTVFKTRVFALGSASPGGMGGLRGVNTVRSVLELGLNALVLPDQFAVPKAGDAFQDNGHLKNKDSQENFKKLIQKIARAAHVLHG